MEALLSREPSSPGYAFQPEGLEREPILARLAQTPQDAVHHAEGDVWTHTVMVVDALAGLPAWRGLEPAERRDLYLAALLHDVGKPDCTRLREGGRIESRGHSDRGEALVRRLLWEGGVPVARREAICRLVRFHQLPFFLVDDPDAARRVHRLSLGLRLSDLAVLAEADGRGRRCADQHRLLDQVELFRELAREQQCFDVPRPFPSAWAAQLYFRQDGRSPDDDRGPQPRCDMVVLCGLPGAGKDTWRRRELAGLPEVSLDAIRRELGIGPEGPQGAIVAAARERAREHLRAGRSFVWNATNLSREVRGKVVDLGIAYGARVRLVHVEAPPRLLFQRNRERPERVPASVLERLLDRWQVPTPDEAHRLDLVESGA